MDDYQKCAHDLAVAFTAKGFIFKTDYDNPQINTNDFFKCYEESYRQFLQLLESSEICLQQHY